MNPYEFFHWLQGFFELYEIDGADTCNEALSFKQARLVVERVDQVVARIDNNKRHTGAHPQVISCMHDVRAHANLLGDESTGLEMQHRAKLTERIRKVVFDVKHNHIDKR